MKYFDLQFNCFTDIGQYNLEQVPMEDKLGVGFNLFTMPRRGTAFVENCCLCELIIQEEGIMNYQVTRINNIDTIIFGPIR